jgi:hypothetical protein
MLGPAGNPSADNLVEVVGFLQQREGVEVPFESCAQMNSAA